jgi:AraC-like DNA-binding protein
MNQPDIERLADLRFLPVAGPLFDSLSDVVFFVKDRDARYVAVNNTLVRRCGLETETQLLGKTALEIFPAPYNRCYHEQDEQVLQTGAALRDVLELHLYVQGAPGWCITTKLPLHDDAGHIIGIVGVSDDIHAPAAQDSGYRELAEGLSHIREHIGETLRIDAVAERCGLSAYQFEQRMKRVFQLTAGQYISKVRIDLARQMLEGEQSPIVDIALACGFSDQSAFTRQFKATTGLTPTEYRRAQFSHPRPTATT